jgi:hypothetical protein
MKKIKIVAMFVPVFALMVAALACRAPISVEEQVQMTVEAITAGETGAEQEAAEPAVQEVEATQEPAEEAAPPADATPTPTVSHQMFPSGPGNLDSWMTDRSSEALAGERRANADNFDTYRLERPFTTQAMDYQAYLDIVRAELSASSPWIYVTIFLEGSPPADVEAAYGAEFDLDLDGRGDWMIAGLVPPGSDWTTDNVRACRDTNNDVGGPTPVLTDPPNSARDGYDDCVFENGYGISPDEAWIRRDPSNSDRVQLAIKHSLIGNDNELQWGAWADEGVKDPSLMDYNDAFTLADAGSPASESQFYPLKMLASVDNTCFWTFDFDPTENYPRMCPLPATPTPTPTPPPPGTIRGFVWVDFNLDGSKATGEPYLSGATVRLGSGSCMSTGVASATTNASGLFEFSGLTAGRYCLSVGSVSGHTATTATQLNIDLDPGDTAERRFGFIYIIE